MLAVCYSSSKHVCNCKMQHVSSIEYSYVKEKEQEEPSAVLFLVTMSANTDYLARCRRLRMRLEKCGEQNLTFQANFQPESKDD